MVLVLMVFLTTSRMSVSFLATFIWVNSLTSLILPRTNQKSQHFLCRKFNIFLWITSCYPQGIYPHIHIVIHNAKYGVYFERIKISIVHKKVGGGNGRLAEKRLKTPLKRQIGHVDNFLGLSTENSCKLWITGV